jgi:hypothetical protein
VIRINARNFLVIAAAVVVAAFVASWIESRFGVHIPGLNA